ncbi:MAG: hypothetical protein WC554_07720 [Clostridia bacterium]|jgi:hypothetical protein
MAKEKSEHGAKTAAGLMLTKYLRQIAAEITELEKNEEGQEVIMSKAEALARKMWKSALGFKETIIGKGGAREEIVHAPDRGLMAILFERIEGRAPLAFNDTSKRNIADRVDDQAKDRISKAGNIKSEDDTNQ